MNRGYIRLYRKTLDSKVFQNEGLLKVWVWCLLRANHKGVWVKVKTGKGFTEVWLNPGQFIFGRNSAAKELKMPPSTVRNRIRKLELMGNIIIQRPESRAQSHFSETTLNQDSQKDSHWSIILIVNWESYQSLNKKEDRQEDRQRTGKGHRQECKECKEEKTPANFLSLRKKYSDQNLIDKVFEAIASTRKSNKVSDSVLLAQLQKWQKYPVEQVEAGIRTYLDKDYASQGKREDYLLGIIRNQKLNEGKEGSTGSLLLDDYYARQSH